MAVAAVLVLGLSAATSPTEAAAALPRAAKIKTGHIGDSLRLRGLSTVLDIVKATVTEKKRLPAAGLYGVKLTVKNVSTFYDEYWDSYPVYEDYLPKSCILVDTKSTRYRVVRKAADENGERLPNQLGTVILERGESASGWLYFALKPGRTARAFRFRPDLGMGYDTGRWMLRSPASVTSR